MRPVASSPVSPGAAGAVTGDSGTASLLLTPRGEG